MDMSPNEIRVKNVMQVDVKTVDKNTALSAAAKLMHALGVSSLIVEPDYDGDAFGIITRKDIVVSLVEGILDGTSCLVEDEMTKPVITVNSNSTIYNCQKIMRMVGVRRLPVVDGNQLVGIISNTDIFSKLIQHID